MGQSTSGVFHYTHPDDIDRSEIDEELGRLAGLADFRPILLRWRHRCSDGLIDDTGKIRNVFTRAEAGADDSVTRVIREINEIPEAVAELEVAAQAHEQMSELGRHQVELPVHDARRLPETSLHTNGFILAAHTSRVADWDDDGQLAEIYNAEMCALVADTVGATHAFASNHLRRRSEPAHGGNGPLARMLARSRGPAHVVHNDFAESYGDGIIKTIAAGGVPHTQTFGMTDAVIAAGVSAETVAGSRLLVINTWRTVSSEPLKRKPLALADRRTVEHDSLRTSRVGKVPSGEPRGGIETFTACYDPRQVWYYYPDMTSDEVLLWKGFDSAEVPAQPPLHSAFTDPATPDDAPERTSVELRVLCLLPQT